MKDYYDIMEICNDSPYIKFKKTISQIINQISS